MDAMKKSFEMQAQVRHNAEEFRNTLNDLYSWEKEMKDKERELQESPAQTNEAEERLKTLPVRSHILEQTTSKQSVQENKDNETNIKENSKDVVNTKVEKHKLANEIKDRGNKHVKGGEYDKAIEEYTAAIETFENDPVFYSNRALCYLKLERYNECIEDCERAIEIDNLAVKAYYRRMQANECLGNNMDALKDCTTVLMIEPKNSEANKSLDRINERLRKNVKSQNGPNFSSLRDNMVDILPFKKPPYKRSTKPLRRIPIADVVGPKESKDYNNSNLKISDEDIEKLFNSNCGPFVEVKGNVETKETKKTANESSKSKDTSEEENSKEKDSQKESELPKKSKDLNQNVNTKLNEKEIKEEIKKPIVPSTEDSNRVSSSVVENKKSKLPSSSNEAIALDTSRPLPPAPTSTAQFYCNWKELNPAQKYLYLKSIEISNVRKVLGAGFDSETLTDMLNVLRDYYLVNKEPKTAETLLEISKNNQTSILSLLMSTEERKVLSDILNSIKEIDSNSTMANEITKNFNLH